MDLLWEKISEVERESRFDGHPYPEGLTGFPGKLRGQGFFPGGDGLWREAAATTGHAPFPTGGVMILGNDFGCLDNPDPRSPGFVQCLAKGYEDPPTWKIRATLRKATIPGDQCFFTNAYLGLRTSVKSTGLSPGSSNALFKSICRDFFIAQMSLQKPKLIVCLGHEPRLFVAPILLPDRHAWRKAMSFPALDQTCDQILYGSLQTGKEELNPALVVIAHPSFAWSTHAQYPRTFLGQKGEAAEIALLAAAWSRANSIPVHL
jgi:hypothetical protein